MHDFLPTKNLPFCLRIASPPLSPANVVRSLCLPLPLRLRRGNTRGDILLPCLSHTEPVVTLRVPQRRLPLTEHERRLFFTAQRDLIYWCVWLEHKLIFFLVSGIFLSLKKKWSRVDELCGCYFLDFLLVLCVTAARRRQQCVEK